MRGWLGTSLMLAGAQQSIYLYFDLAKADAIGDEDLRVLEDVFRHSFPQAGQIVASRLLCVLDVRGASTGEQTAPAPL